VTQLTLYNSSANRTQLHS